MPLQREGSFKLEQVNEDAAADSAKRGGRSNPYASGASNGVGQRSGNSAGRERDSRRDFKDTTQAAEEEEDEVTVGLGQADYLDAQLRGGGAGNTNSNRKYNSFNPFLNNDITSASSEFTPGVVALGSDNKPNYRSGAGRQQGAVDATDDPPSKMKDSIKDKAPAPAERKFEASDFVSPEQPSNTSKNSPNGGSSNGNSAATGTQTLF